MGVVHPTKLRQNLRVLNLQDCVWEIHYQIIMKTMLQEKDTFHHSIAIWHTKFIPMPQAMKIPAAKVAMDKEWEKMEKISAWNLTKVRSKKEVIDEAKTSGAKVHFASLIGHLSFEKMLSWRQSTKSTKVELCSAVIL